MRGRHAVRLLEPSSAALDAVLGAMHEAGTGSGYCTREWLECCEHVHQGSTGLLVLERGGEVRAAVPVVARDHFAIGPFRLASIDSLPGGAIGGYWSQTPADLSELLAANHSAALENSVCASTHLKTFVRAAAFPLWDNPAHRGMLTTARLAVLRLPSSVASLARTYEGGHRRNVRASERSGCEIRVATGAEDLWTFYGLVAETMRRVGERPRVTAEFYREVSRRLVECGRGALYLAHSGQRAIAGIFVVHDSRRSYYWLGGMERSEETVRLRPMFALFHTAFSDAVRAGRGEFELGGVPTDGLRRFKLGWGSALEAFVEYRRVNRWIAPAHRAYRRLKHGAALSMPRANEDAVPRGSRRDASPL